MLRQSIDDHTKMWEERTQDNSNNKTRITSILHDRNVFLANEQHDLRLRAIDFPIDYWKGRYTRFEHPSRIRAWKVIVGGLPVAT